MAELFANQSESTLNGTITSEATSLVVASAATFPIEGNFRIVVGTELMLVTKVEATKFTVTRGIEGTTKAAHTTAAPVAHVLTVASAKYLGEGYGIVTVLPTGVAIGARCTYKAAASIYWQLVYTKESETYPWSFVGGPQLYVRDDSQKSATGSVYVSLTEPLKLTIPVKGDYDVTIECNPSVSIAAVSTNLSYTIGEIAPSDAWSAPWQASAQAGGTRTISTTTRQLAIPAGAVLEEKAKSGTTGFWSLRKIRATPLRVG